ncbi:MAG: hypothetical protein ACLQNE_36235 [Thermoguttaceae bacterium]
MGRGVWLDGFWRVLWQPETVRVKAIDPARRQITFAQPVNGGIGSEYAGPEGSGKENRRAVNLLEEIDRPGEWCIDFPSKTLYFWPQEPLEKAAMVLADNDQPLVQLKDVAHVVFRGLTFKFGLGNGVGIHGSEDVLLAACTFCNLGRMGVIRTTNCERHGPPASLHPLRRPRHLPTPPPLTPRSQSALHRRRHDHRHGPRPRLEMRGRPWIGILGRREWRALV